MLFPIDFLLQVNDLSSIVHCASSLAAGPPAASVAKAPNHTAGWVGSNPTTAAAAAASAVLVDPDRQASFR